MKKFSFFLMAMLLSFAASIQAAEVTETIAMKKFGGLSTSSYENVTKTGTSDLGTEMVAYAFNPSTGQVRGNKTTIAGASVTSADKNKNWSLYNNQAMPGAIKSITVTQTATGSNKFQNNMYVALGTTNQGAVTTVSGAQKNTTTSATKFTFDIDETQGYTYFKLLSNEKFTSNSVEGVVVTVTYVTSDENPDETKYTVTTKVNDETMGTVTGAGEYAEGKTATLTANPNNGYKFVNWSNGETANPLKLTVTENIEITANFEVIPPMTCAEAAATASGETVVLKPFDVVYVVKDAGYIYIKDESGYNLIYDFNLDDKLKAGDHVEGFIGTSSPYNGLPELKSSVSYSDLTVTPGTAPEPTLMAAAPTKAELNQYVKFENVTISANATFTTASATNATMVVNGTNVTLRNNFKLAATLSKDKAYNIVGFVAIYNSTIQVYYLSAEEYVAPEPCTLATAINWDDAIEAKANTDQWYAVNIASAIAAKKDIALTVANPGAAAVEVTVEAYANCPATEKIAGATSTINAGATKTTTVKYDEYLADQVEVVYLHVVTSGDLTVDAEVIEPCTQATAINWNDPISAAANLDAWYAVNVESAIAAGKDLALTVSNPSTEAVEVSIEAYANCPATELIVKSTSTINAGASKTTTVKYDEYLADQVKVVYMHVTTKGGEIKVEAETAKFNVTATAENGTVEGAGVYEQGTEATLTATPAEGYKFVSWTADDVELSTENPYTFVVTADVALVANFELVPVVEPEKPEPTYTDNNLNPYAFGLESKLSDDKTTLTVTYRLNNSNATSVNVVVYNGEDIVALVPGTTTIGVNTVEVATGDLPAGVELKWAVEVKGTSVDAPTREEKIYSFYHPSGVDIDINPENETFGLLLVNEGMQSVASKTEGYVSAGFGAGIFAFTPSFDLIPNGELPGYNGGNAFTTTRADGTGTAYAPRRIRISEDGRIFVTSLNTDGNYLWEVNPENMNEWTTIFKGTLNDQRELVDAEGNFVAAPNNGFDVKGSGENLQLAMYSVNLSGITAAAMSGFRLHEYNLGTATEWTTAPSKAIVEGKYAINYTGTQVEYDNEGGLWIASYRGSATDANPGLVHINAEGVEDCKLVWNNVRQAGIRFNKDFTKLVVAGNNGAAKKATIYTISKDENGAPVLTEETVVDMSVVGNNLNDFAWDYAGNLYSCGNSSEKLAAWAMPYSGTVETPAAAQYAFQLPEPMKMAGVVKRAVQNGDEVIVLTHEADGTAHIYQVVDGKAIAEISQEGVIARDPENAGDLLAISDIAVTEDGKLVAVNSMVCQAAEDYVDAGYKRGETRFYIWNELDADPTVWFKSNMYGNWFRSKEGGSMAIKGTSTNAQIMVTSIHATKYWSRFSVYSVIDGVYNEPADAATGNEHYTWCEGPAAGDLDENVLGVQYELNASATAGNWIVDAELANPIEFVQPATIKEVIATLTPLTEDLGKKYQGVSIVTVGEKNLMVAPFANPDGQLVGAEILNITNGFDAPQYVDMVYVDEAVAATAAATAVQVVEGGLNITLVADATIHTWFVEMSEGPVYEIYEDAITNLVIDYDNMLLIGGPSDAFQVEVVLGLGDYDRNTDNFALLPESSISVLGSEATFIDGIASVDGIAQTALAVVHCMWNGMALEFHLTMSAATIEPTVVVVENAVIEIEKYLLWGDMYDYALKMTGVWTNEGVDYPVLVEVPVYYPEATEPSTIFSTVTVGGMGDNDPWLGFGEGDLTITTEGDKITATGIVTNPMAGIAIDITISGTITPTGIEDATVVAKPVKMIKNGQLIIEKDGVQYNAQGATVK